jgi:cytoskeleton protein RodZ
VTEIIEEVTGVEAPLGPGATLRQAREARGLDIDDIANALKLTPKQVAAIEQEDFQQLPGATFARGFVRNYARLMQLDAAPLLAVVDRSSAKRDVELAPLATAIGTMPAASAARSVPRWLLIAFGVVAVALLLVVYVERFQGGSWTFWRPAKTEAVSTAPVSSGTPGTETLTVAVTPLSASPVPAPDGPATVTPSGEVPVVLPPPVSTAPVAAAPTDAVPPGPTPTASPGTATTESRKLKFGFEVDSWVEVKDATGKMLVSKLNTPGSILEVEGSPPFALVVGNAKGVQLAYDGKPVDLKPYTTVTVARFNLE